MGAARRELERLLLAIGFLTRLPLPPVRDFSDAKLNGAARYFPLAGVLVGALAALGFIAAHALFDHLVLALLLSTALGVLITGAFHEDGFADFCDGFGGGWTPEQVLAIMKDSRIGSYAAIGLALLLSIKLAALAALPVALIPAALVIGHAWSRWLSTSLLTELVYVREAGKSKPLATVLEPRALAIATLSVAPLALLLGAAQLLAVLLGLAAFRWGFARYLRRRIGGYTGDCLGAAQQLAEVLVYLALAAVA